ncbi:MAG: type II secretion system protein GspM [Marinicella pacifica]
MKLFLSQLSHRERQLLNVGAVLILLTLFWLLVFRPVSNYLNRQAHLKIQLQQQLSAMQQSAGQLTGRQVISQQALPADKTFSAWLDGQLQQLNLQNAVKRSEPVDDKTVTIWLESVSFDTWVDWLQDIHQKYGVTVDQADIIISDRPAGLVNIRMRITTL